MSRVGSVSLRAVRGLLAVIATLVLISCENRGGAGNEHVLKVAHNGNEQHPFQRGYEYFARVLEDRSNGGVTLRIFPNSQLGSEEETVEMVKLGVISSTVSASATLGPFVPEADVLNFPFIFRDHDHFYRVLDGAVGERIAENIAEDADMLVLGWWFSGVRNVWNAQRPVYKPEDLEGLKIRVIGSAVVVDAFNSLGAQATTMSFGELYSAVQQGVLDGGESDHTDLLVEKFHEVTEYVSLTQHLYLAAPLLFSKKKFEKLPADIQGAILAAGHASVAAQRAAMESDNRKSLRALRSMGLRFNEVDSEAFRSKIRKELVYRRYAEHVGGWSAIEAVLAR